MKKILLLTLCVALFACTNEPVPEKGDEGQSYVPTQSVDLDRDKLEMVVGDVVELRATVNPKNATNQNVEWESSDQTVVSVRNGEVKAIGPGRAIVTVNTEEGGYTSECVVYVSPKVQTQKKGPMTLSLRYVTATTAELSGFLDVDQLAGYDVSGGGVGFIYAPSGTKLDIDNAEKVSISSVDSENAFSKTLTGLKYDTRYYYTIYLRKNGILQYGETQYFDTKEVTISVDQVSVTPTKATLKGKVVRLSEDSAVKVGLMYSSSNTFPSGSKSYTITPYSDGSYTQEITGLTAGATYYYRTYLYYGGRYEYGETKEFTTNTINVTLSVSSKTATTVTFAGKMNPVTDKSDVAIGVYVNTSETVNSSNYKRRAVVYDSDIADDGTFSVTVTGLSMATQYFYTPYVYSTKYAYGEIKDFTTENIVVALSVKSTDITATTAKITGTITSLSDVDKSEIDAIGIAYSTSSSSLKTSSSTKKSATLSSDGKFSISLEGLYTDTKHYYCSYVKQDGVYTYGETKELTTKNVTPSVSLVESSLTATKVTINGTVPTLSSSDKSRLEFGIAYSTSSGSLKTSSSTKETAALSSDGTFSVSLENLTTYTKYYYCSYVKQNGIYTYGETKEFNTVNVIPSVSVVESSISATTATISGMVSNLSDSDMSSLEFGVAYSTSSSSLKTSSSTKETATLSSDGTFSMFLGGLDIDTKYYYCFYMKQNGNYTYGETKEFSTVDIIPSVSVVESSITATKATISGSVPNLSDSDKSSFEFGVAYSISSSSLKTSSSTQETATLSSDGTFSVFLNGLDIGTKYYYCSYVKQNGIYTYGETKEFNTVNVIPSVSVVESSITATKVTISGSVPNLSDSDKSSFEFGVAYSTSSSSLKTSSSTQETATLSSDGTFSVFLDGLYIDTKYYYCSYVKQDGIYTYGETKEFTTLHPYNAPVDLDVASATDLSYSVSANCYIVSQTGLYKFKTVKGNSSESVGSVASASILWETFGTDTTPEVLDLISGFCYKDGYIAFQTADTFREGNAVIAAKDADGNILWSWHIWFTDQPQAHVYNNNAGTMMDRNLGATSATPGDVGALGLLYQWGRKDPFLGSSSFSSNTVAKSTISWPSPVSTNSSRGTVSYVTANPTTFVTGDSSSNNDWHYSSRDNTFWTTSDKIKSIYDPCPAGWRVPDGGGSGVWSKALGSSSSFYYTYNSTNEGMNFSGKFGSASTIWYPASGYRYGSGGGLSGVGDGDYWSASPSSNGAYGLNFYGSGSVLPSYSYGRAHGRSVRCLQESK